MNRKSNHDAVPHAEMWSDRGKQIYIQNHANLPRNTLLKDSPLPTQTHKNYLEAIHCIFEKSL